MPSGPRAHSPFLNPSLPLIGRDREIADLETLVSRGRYRFVTVTGLGGVGKTRLVQEIAQRTRDVFDDRIFYVALDTVDGPDQVAATIAQILRLKASSSTTLAGHLADTLQDTRALLILDTFFHVREASDLIGQLLDACRGLTVLVNSRARLRSHNEYTFVLAPLAVPERIPLSRDVALETVAANPAVRLFIHRCQLLNSHFRLTPDNVRDVVEICRLSNGIPLAIELMAGQILAMSVAELLEEARHTLLDIRSVNQDLPSRQQTMRRAFDWGYALLSPEAQQLVLRCAVFAGSFIREAILAVAGRDLQARLQEALDAHFIAHVPGPAAAGQRFIMLGSIRQFALEMLEAMHDGGDDVKLRLIRYVDLLVDHLTEERWEQSFQDEVAALTADMGTIRQALAWAQDIDPVAGIHVAVNLEWYWFYTSRRAEGYAWLSRLLPYVDDPSIDRRLRFRMLRAAGHLAIHALDHERAVDLLTQAHAMLDAAKNSVDVGMTLQQLGLAYVQLRRFTDAEPILAKAWEIANREQCPVLKAAVAGTLGTSALFKGNLDDAEKAFWEDLEYHSVSAEPAGTSGALHFLGYIAALRGDFERGRTLLHRAVNLVSGREGSEWLFYLQALARLETLAGNYREAATIIPEYLKRRLLRKEWETVRSGLCDAASAVVASGDANLHEIAAELFGAGEALDLTKHPMVFFADQVLASLRQLQQQIPDYTFRAAYTTGRNMAKEDVIALAIETMNVIESPETDEMSEGGPGPDRYGLTSRELDVLRLLTTGMSDRAISDELSISLMTVHKHVQRIRRKLDVSSRSAAVSIALRERLVDLSDD